jgi:hypothetical protein
MRFDAGGAAVAVLIRTNGFRDPLAAGDRVVAYNSSLPH